MDADIQGWSYASSRNRSGELDGVTSGGLKSESAPAAVSLSVHPCFSSLRRSLTSPVRVEVFEGRAAPILDEKPYSAPQAQHLLACSLTSDKQNTRKSTF